MTKKGFRRFCLMLCGLIGIVLAGRSHAACEGRNLWAEFAESHPAAAAAADEQAQKMPFGEGRLYRLTRPGHPVSYVFGTIHLYDSRYLPLAGNALRALDETRVTVLELPSVKEASMLELAEKKPKEFILATFAEAGQRPGDFLSPEEQAQINTVAEKAGMPGSYFLAMRPTLLAATLMLTVCPHQNGAESGVDGALESMSLKAFKPVIGLETAFEQLAALNELPFDVQKQVLYNALGELDRTPDALETLKQLYAEGRIGLVLLGMQGKIPEFTAMGEPSPPAYNKAVLDDRNHRMVQRALPLLAADSTFLAVGAAHLPGEVGILKLLQDAGYKVEKIE